MTLLLLINAIIWIAAGASIGYTAGHRHGARWADARREHEIRVLNDLLALDPHGDD